MTEQMPSPEEMQQGAEVVEAGQAAAAAEPDPAKRKGAAAAAIQKKAEARGWQLSEKEADVIATMVAAKITDDVADKTVDRIREAGGFDRLPDPVEPPAAPTGTGTLPAEPARTEAPAVEEQGPGKPRSFAAKFRGGW